MYSMRTTFVIRLQSYIRGMIDNEKLINQVKFRIDIAGTPIDSNPLY